jgi:hypothetical protein
VRSASQAPFTRDRNDTHDADATCTIINGSDEAIAEEVVASCARAAMEVQP